MMVAEIAGGTIFGSMALLADGWHMSTHAGALAIAAFAYRFARRHARDPRFAFGTGKLGDLAGFASAIVLALVAADDRLRIRRCGCSSPCPSTMPRRPPSPSWALLVNLLSAWMLGAGHDHDHDMTTITISHHHDHDHNLRAAFWHVHGRCADLGAGDRWPCSRPGRTAGRWADPAIGIVGALVIAHWSWRLIREFGRRAARRRAQPRARARRSASRLEIGHDRIADLHVWRLGPGHHAAIVSLVSDAPQPVEDYKARLADLRGLSHVTVEVLRCNDAH